MLETAIHLHTFSQEVENGMPVIEPIIAAALRYVGGLSHVMTR